jgi:Mn-dependent DtxR family transcriptional regulator
MRASAEDYLETILLLSRRNVVVRSIDVALAEGYSKASVSVAMRKLRESGFVLVDRQGGITLTASGLEQAQRVYERHAVIRRWLVENGVSEEAATADACRMEHIISEETFALIQRLADRPNTKA